MVTYSVDSACILALRTFGLGVTRETITGLTTSVENIGKDIVEVESPDHTEIIRCRIIGFQKIPGALMSRRTFFIAEDREERLRLVAKICAEKVVT